MIDASKVYKVYSGRPGCMCGCKGQWRYASAHAAYGSQDRGSAVDADEISDRSVNIIVRKLNASQHTKIQDNTAYLETDTRIIAAYLRS